MSGGNFCRTSLVRASSRPYCFTLELRIVITPYFIEELHMNALPADELASVRKHALYVYGDVFLVINLHRRAPLRSHPTFTSEIYVATSPPVVVLSNIEPRPHAHKDERASRKISFCTKYADRMLCAQ